MDYSSTAFPALQNWRIGLEGEQQLLIEHPGNLSLNPSATLALYAGNGAHELTLFHLPGCERETIEIEGTLLHGS